MRSVTVAVRGRGEGNRQTMETGGGVTCALTTVAKDNMILEIYEKAGTD